MALKSGNSLKLLLMDLNFRDWVIQPKPETERYWKTWLKNNPDKKEDFLLAKELIQKLEFKRVEVTDERYEKIFEKTLLGKKSNYVSSKSIFHEKVGSAFLLARGGYVGSRSFHLSALFF